MANALESASLVMIPSGYEDGTLGSLKPTDGTGDFTFTRGSNISATRVNADGYIEKGYENLLYPSNDFSQWTDNINNASVTSGHSGYDGTNDAWLLSAINNFSRIGLDVPASGVQSFSVYAKASTYNFMRLRADGSNTAQCFFDLENGTLGTETNSIESKIESIGNGWYRCSIILSSTTTNLKISAAQADNDLNGTDGSIYIQDAMLNQGMVAYPYVETTTAPVAGGILEDMPRLDYSNGSCPSLLLEPERTNIVPNSEYITQPVNGTNTYNQGISPEGVNNAVKYTADTTFPNIRFTGFSVTTGTQYTFSCFVKYIGYQWMYINFNNGFTNDTTDDCWFDVENGEVGTIGSSINNQSIEPYGNGWYRISATSTAISTGTGQIRLHNTGADNTNTLSSGEIGLHNLIYGAQLEEASYPTSYIPTYGVSQTRLEDLATNAGDANTFNSTEGVLFAELSFVDNTSFKFISLNSGISTNRVSFYSSSPSLISVNVRNSSGNQFNGNFSIDSTINHKIAVKYKENDFALWIDGQERLSDSSGTTFPPSTLTQLDYDDGNGNSPFNGIVKQLLVFPTALSDEACIELTTI